MINAQCRAYPDNGRNRFKNDINNMRVKMCGRLTIDY